MTRWTPAALHKMARAASNTQRATLTLATHPHSGTRFAAWGYGCIALPATLLDEFDNLPDGSYTITTSGGTTALVTTEIRGLSAALVINQMLPLLDTGDRAPAEVTGWLHEDGPLTRRYLRADGRPIAVVNDHWQAWTKHADQPAWHTPNRGGLILWAPDATSRATALLSTIHHRFAPTPPNWTPEGPQ